jgi:hypothetical protein
MRPTTARKEEDRRASVTRMAAQAARQHPPACPLGNCKGRHWCDTDMARVVSFLMAVPVRSVLSIPANPGDGQEWKLFHDCAGDIPSDKMSVPGAVDATTHFVEHPDLGT